MTARRRQRKIVIGMAQTDVTGVSLSMPVDPLHREIFIKGMRAVLGLVEKVLFSVAMDSIDTAKAEDLIAALKGSKK